MNDTKAPPPIYQPPPQFELPSSSSSSTANSSINNKTCVLDEEQLHKRSDQNSLSTRWKLTLRVVQLLCVIGSFGFQASANTWSGRMSAPLDNVALLYLFYGIEWVAFVWSLFCIYVYLSLRYNSNSSGNIKPAIGFAMDTLLAMLLGITISMEIGSYTCPAGGFDGWCNFYNTGVGFGLLLFLTFGANALWDLFSGLSCLRTK